MSNSISIPIGESVMCPISALQLDLDNPRLQTGEPIESANETEVIQQLIDIAALDELITSITTNTYLNLEPLLIYGKDDSGPFTVLEGNRRLAAITLIRNPKLADQLEIKVPQKITQAVLNSTDKILVHRVLRPDDAREFIGFKHINGPQRWDAYAKARYVTDWYKAAKGKITIADISAKMGDNNNTLRSYIYAILILDQAKDQKIWNLSDRPKVRGRFGFSHLYTAINRQEFQDFLGLHEWSNTPGIHPIEDSRKENLGEVLTYLYGSVSDSRSSLIKSQNPDLKDIGLAIASPTARAILQNRGALDDARDALKTPNDAFYDALVASNLKLKRAISFLPKYSVDDKRIVPLIEEIFEQADTLKTMAERKASRKG